MDRPWLLTASTVSLVLFGALVGIAATGLVVSIVLKRRASRSREAGPQLGTQARTLIEYLGNTSLPEVPSFGPKDRRHNKAARVLMDHARDEALRRNAPASEVNRMVQELREAIQAAERAE